MATTMHAPRSPGFSRALLGRSAAVAVDGIEVSTRCQGRGPEHDRRQNDWRCAAEER